MLVAGVAGERMITSALSVDPVFVPVSPGDLVILVPGVICLSPGRLVVALRVIGGVASKLIQASSCLGTI